MRLYEFEAKSLLGTSGVRIPNQLQCAPLPEISFTEAAVLKGQVLFGNRKQQNLIHLITTESEFSTTKDTIAQALVQIPLSLEKTNILVEERIAYSEEVYLAIRYDTATRLPVLLFSSSGGSGIEDRASSADLQSYPLERFAESDLPVLHPNISAEWLRSLLQLFFEQDMTLLEINPLVFVENEPMALDAKIELDDTAQFRHPEWEKYPPRTLFARQPSERERQAKEVNAMDHRGIAGAAYFEFPGTIGILASGGGASLLAMDALLSTDLRPANYTEYSGNPQREKVAALSRIVLSQNVLQGLWVIGGHANFTDIYETLMGVMDAVEEAAEQHLIQPGFPIIIRRGGPRQEEAFTACRERAAKLQLNIQLFDSSFPITDTVGILDTAVQAYRKSGEGEN